MGYLFIGPYLIFILTYSFRMYTLLYGKKVYDKGDISIKTAKEDAANMIMGNIAGVIYFLCAKKLYDMKNLFYAYYYGWFQNVVVSAFIVSFLLTFFLLIHKLDNKNRVIFISYSYVVISIIGLLGYYYITRYINFEF